MKAILTVAAIAMASPAHAQTSCATHDEQVSYLAREWGESRHAIGMTMTGAVVEIFASPQTGTWTIAVTTPGGPTCLATWGSGFEILDEALPNTDPPT
ncbi:MAG: hypothetical protein VKL39_07085 [Leptolyngbyaceae bacterium]|nr:hypothetical protein [Leptolyngbyaceae bacterium]